MRRRLFNVVSAASLVLFVATAATWVLADLPRSPKGRTHWKALAYTSARLLSTRRMAAPLKVVPIDTGWTSKRLDRRPTPVNRAIGPQLRLLEYLELLEDSGVKHQQVRAQKIPMAS